MSHRQVLQLSSESTQQASSLLPEDSLRLGDSRVSKDEADTVKEKKTIAFPGYSVEQAQQDSLSPDPQTRANGFFHLAYYGRYDLCAPLENKENTEGQQTIEIVAKRAMVQGAAAAGDGDTVFALLRGEKSSDDTVQGALCCAARGGHVVLLRQLMKAYPSQEKAVIRGFNEGGFLAGENYPQLLPILYDLAEPGLFLLQMMQASNYIRRDIVLPMQLSNVGFVPAQIIMNVTSDEAEKMQFSTFVLNSVLPSSIINMILSYDFESKDLTTPPKSPILEVVINAVVRKTISQKNLICASMEYFSEEKLNLALLVIAPIWLYKNWDILKIFYQLMQEKTDTKRYDTAQKYIQDNPHHLFAKKLQGINPLSNVEHASSMSLQLK